MISFKGWIIQRDKFPPLFHFIFKNDFMSTFRVEKSVKHYLNQIIRVNITSNAY